MNLQDEADFAHTSQHGFDLADVGDARVGMGRRAGRVEFESGDQAAGLGAVDLRRTGAVGQIQSHERLEVRACRERVEDAAAIRERLLGCCDRRLEVRHHDRARETRGGKWQDGAECRAVTQVQVPIVRAS